MGYTRDDAPLIELMLDEKGRRNWKRSGIEFEFVADYTARTYVQFYFNQSGEVLGNGAESGTLRPSDKDITAEPGRSWASRRPTSRRPQPTTGTTRWRSQAIVDHFDRVNATLRAIERTRIDAEPRHLDALLTFAARAYRRPLSAAERDDLLGVLPLAARDERSVARRSDARLDRQRADVAALLLSARPDRWRATPASPARRPERGAGHGPRPTTRWRAA